MNPLPLIILAALLVSPVAQSTSFYEAPFADALKEAPVFVRGTVGKSDVQAVTLPDGSQAPFTFWELQVSESFKGKLKGPQIRFRQLGGEKQGLGFSVSGGAEFSAGEDVVLMLDEPSAESGDGAYPLRGLSTGKYVVQNDEAGNEILVGSGIQSSSESGQPSQNHLTLDEVRKLAKAPAAAKVPAAAAPPAPSERSVNSDGGSPANGTAPPPNTLTEASPTAAVSKRWVLIAGALLGIVWYRRRRRKL